MKFFAGSGPRLVPPHAVPTGALEDLLTTRKVASTFVAENVATFRTAAPGRSAPVVGVTAGGRGLPGRRTSPLELTGACWVGSNVVPVVLDDAGIQLVADHLLTQRRPRASFFGPQREVLGLWNAVEQRWSEPFAVREEQPLMVAQQPSESAPHPEVRPADPSEFSDVLPASAAMFEEEVGYSPFVDGDNGYVHRVSRLIQDQRTFVVMRDGRVVFKADIGAGAGEVCQIQGVWVAPEHRGQGWAVPCMTAVVEAARRRWPVVSLYVNSYNQAALRTYRRAGFVQVDTFATVLL